MYTGKTYREVAACLMASGNTGNSERNSAVQIILDPIHRQLLLGQDCCCQEQPANDSSNRSAASNFVDIFSTTSGLVLISFLWLLIFI